MKTGNGRELPQAHGVGREEQMLHFILFSDMWISLTLSQQLSKHIYQAWYAYSTTLPVFLIQVTASTQNAIDLEKQF